MSDANMTGGLVQNWVAVTGADGELRLEAHWVDPSTPTHITHAA